MNTPRIIIQALRNRKKLVLSLLVILPIAAMFLFGNRGLIKRVSLEHRYDEAYQELYQARATADSLRQEIHRMRTDPNAIERVAREKYGMVRPNETVYRIEESE